MGGGSGFTFLNNDAKGRVPANARTLVKMLGKAAVSWPPRQESEGGTKEASSAGFASR